MIQKNVASQINAIFRYMCSSVKVGKWYNAEIAKKVTHAQNIVFSVVDPVMVAKGGSPLLDKKQSNLLKTICYQSQQS